jgi:hypothetical protein
MTDSPPVADMSVDERLRPVATDLERLFRMRVVLARVGEMDLAKWWNTTGQLGPIGTAAVRRGLPRTHYFAQARSVFAVAAHRCDEWFNPPGSVTLWRLPDQIEEQFEARWEHWLDNASDWKPFFEEVEGIKSNDLAATLRAFHLVTDADIDAVGRLQVGASGRALQLPGTFAGATNDVTMLAIGFSRGSAGSLTVPYARLGDE